ncbi:hypothetical protein [Bacillus cereus]|uniref:hypothetical protein n=1 Tax=Bacillus cereus TaxID=1396 RepID=UPI000BFA737A|nr:hypothetical protein [Bacillus cereus]PES10274.1 hypothetical protein CN494_25055 [Bacillus cereus]PFC33725.1 hypothetical protein CN310_30580 [Bacillus cereus]PFQ75290.1 hypothetical protein COK15_16500 [Bacillus cereus]PFU16018.1 hypothetical protein COK79_08065 [Bacillus cereus]PGW68868.1 hypothetical protein COE26_13165 [Bacillus cereus]
MKELSSLENLQPSDANLAPDISNLSQCIDDIKNAIFDSDTGPSNPKDYNELRGKLEACREKLPLLYQKAVFEPFLKTLNDIGRDGFNEILLRSDDLPQVMFDIAQAILQYGEGYNQKATRAFQEVVSDIYDGFLSNEDRRRVKRPDKSVIPPLVKWGNPGKGPYTCTIDTTSETFGLQTGIVSLPPVNARHGVLAWGALGHETGGHDILHADTGLLKELSTSVFNELIKQNLNDGLPEYWASRIDETASDVLGILNMGPAAGISLIGYFRGLLAASQGKPELRNIGPENDPHPADILRGYLAASTVKLLSFDGAKNWAEVIASETDKDLKTILLDGTQVSAEDARKSAEIVASVIAQSRLQVLGGHALSEIQNWRNTDEMIVQQLRSNLSVVNPLPNKFESGVSATHVVAASVVEAVSSNGNLPRIFDRMLGMLNILHDANPSWGPLYIALPGNIFLHRAYRNLI